ncbi:unnamed protein product [Urochloa decumbens]|uniref:FBD domain-containing protein n=1 Tax=Urochloa decumbens TaxID=240449 RepID=A0ABC9D2V1_9POAL
MPTATSRLPPRRHSSAVGMVAGAKVKGKGRLRAEEEEGQGMDRISGLPDAILGDIVSLLPAKDGARTQVLSSRWRCIWLSAPLNLDLRFHPIPFGAVTHILSSHPGPGRRFSTPVGHYCYNLSAANLDDCLLSPALNNLQELSFGYDVACDGNWGNPPPLPASVLRLSPWRWNWQDPPPLLTSALRFSRTLRIARFRVCRFPDEINVHLPLLQELGLSKVIISESSLQALLAGCPALQSLMLTDNNGYSSVHIASPTLRSMYVASGSRDIKLQRLIIEDAPCLERLHDRARHGEVMKILVISAPKLGTLGHLDDRLTTLQVGTAVFQGLRPVTMTAVVRSVKVIALKNTKLSLDVILNFMRCFPCLEELNIRTIFSGKKNVWGPKYRNLRHLKKLVLIGYEGCESHVNFVKFFVLKARVLESIRLEVPFTYIMSRWIGGQRKLLQFEKRASRSAQLDIELVRGYQTEALLEA